MKLNQLTKSIEVFKLLFIFLTLSTSTVFAQRTVKGAVRDDNTNEPLFGVNIVIKGSSIGYTCCTFQ